MKRTITTWRSLFLCWPFVEPIETTKDNKLESRISIWLNKPTLTYSDPHKRRRWILSVHWQQHIQSVPHMGVFIYTICSLTDDLQLENQGHFLSVRIKLDQSLNQTGQTTQHVVLTDGEVWGQSFTGYTTDWLTTSAVCIVRVHLGHRERERERWILFSVLGGNCHVWINKQTIGFLPHSAGKKLQNCPVGVQNPIKASVSLHNIFTKKSLIPD